MPWPEPLQELYNQKTRILSEQGAHKGQFQAPCDGNFHMEWWNDAIFRSKKVVYVVHLCQTKDDTPLAAEKKATTLRQKSRRGFPGVRGEQRSIEKVHEIHEKEAVRQASSVSSDGGGGGGASRAWAQPAVQQTWWDTVAASRSEFWVDAKTKGAVAGWWSTLGQAR